jgi:signal transduction histidine kinase
MPKIFKNILTLKYESLDLETKYTRMRLKNIKLLNIIFSSIALIFSLTNTILFSINDSTERAYLHTRYITYTTTGSVFIVFLMAILVENPRIQVYISYFNFFLELYPFYCLRIYISTIQDALISFQTLVYIIQLLFRLLWFFTNILDFMEGALLAIIKLIATYVCFGPLTPFEFHYKFALHNVIVTIQFAIIYFYVYEKKKAYYYNKKLKDQNLWYNSIIQNMDNGFLKVKSERIIFVNESLCDKLKMIQEFGQDDFDLLRPSGLGSISLRPTKSKSTLILNTLFKNIEINDSQFDDDNTWVNCKNITKAKNSDNHFNIIGMLKLIINADQVIYYEVFSRFMYLIDNEEVYEFMFKDISISKMNAELKYKTLFLSKIAHEFKNPLLSIHEFVNQIRDIILQIFCYNKLKIEELLQGIESISDYLIILVKDMDFFSHVTSDKSAILVKNEIRVNDIVTFCKNITEILIKKAHKNIIFKTEIENSPNILLTDEIKLKEILINLLSNAVKFTTNGSIFLKISVDSDNFIEFQVQDTGKGIDKQKEDKLFQPFFDDVITSKKDPTKIGFGLGLYIVKELLSLLDSEILYESEEGKGTIFKFKLPLGNILSSYIPYRKKSTDTTSMLEVYNYSNTTQKINYNPIYLHNANNKLNTALDNELNDNFENSINNSYHSNVDYKYILLTDDEPMTRKSTIRLINKYFNNDLTIKLKILEASDGIECLYVYYQTKKKGIELSCIISDETMNYLNGTESAKILQNIYSVKNITGIPFYLLTAYEQFNVKDCGIDDVFSKPLSISHLNVIRAKIMTL